MNISLIYPGVGSQYNSMGRAQYDNFSIVRDTFHEVSELVQMDLAALCFHEERSRELNILGNAQLCIFTLSIAYHRLLNSFLSVSPDYTCGYSLGEYSALCASGAISLADAVQLIQSRAKVLQKITDMKIGSMIWVIELDETITKQICDELCEDGYCIYVSGYNSKKQTAVSGDNRSINRAISLFEEFGAIIIPLDLTGPYHSILMKDASEEMIDIVQQCTFHPTTVPVIANWNACFYEYGKYPQYLIRQLVYPIQWMQSMQKICDSHPDLIIEVGPKEVLTYIAKKYNPNANVLSMDKTENLERICDLYENSCMC